MGAKKNDILQGTLALLVVEQAISLRTSTLRRRVTPLDHQFLVDTYAPARYPSVDVFLPSAGEDIELLENTYRHVARLRWPGALTVNVAAVARAELLFGVPAGAFAPPPKVESAVVHITPLAEPLITPSSWL